MPAESVWHCYPIFDTRTDKNNRPLDERLEAVEGDVIFRRDGVVILGESGGFTCECPIVNAVFGGCTANRSLDDNLLRIVTPTGREFIYRYVVRHRNWYRYVKVEKQSSMSAEISHEYREDASDIGPILGALTVFGRYLLSTVFVVAGVVLGGMSYVGIAGYLAEQLAGLFLHHGKATVGCMQDCIWFVEGMVAAVWFLSLLAQGYGGAFFRLYLPLLFLALVPVVAMLIFPGLGEICIAAKAIWSPQLR